VYYLHRGTTKTGKPKYFFSMRSEGDLIERIPEGYEVYEHPNAQVYLQRIQPKLISDAEVQVVQAEIGRHPHLRDCRVDVKKNVITVYEPNQDVDDSADRLAGYGVMAINNIRDLMRRSLTYTAVLRFVLEDEEERVFIAERFCFLGSIDDWIQIGQSGPLTKLVRSCIRHIGRDSLYELF
jgi:hypothetical protein